MEYLSTMFYKKNIFKLLKYFYNKKIFLQKKNILIIRKYYNNKIL